jgi:hypothetical protein
MQEELKQPFFVKFLEHQKVEDNKHGITKPILDPPDQTHKYPSDGDETWDFTS